MSTHLTPEHEVVVVGAGFSGIGAAIKLRKAGFSDFVVIDEASGAGGTWHWNTYPGVAVDIPSFSYQFSFEPRSDWSRTYALGPELKRYADHCIDSYDVRRHFRFNTPIKAADYDATNQIWQITTGSGVITARYLINATGVLTQPKDPDIRGVEEFKGEVQHTARWNHQMDLTGKRVGVIGTGASAVQLIPKIAPDVEKLTVFQRTPIWCLPKLDLPLGKGSRSALRFAPGASRAARLASQAFVEFTFPFAAHYHGKHRLADRMSAGAKAFLKQQVKDPETREKLTPKYAIGCKRPSFHNSYLSTFNRENVVLETESISHITADGVVTESGTEHQIDVLVLATGFKVFDKGNLPTFPVRGVGGTALDEWWDTNRYQAYEGISVPGFPNMFSVFGPYGYNGSSYFNLIETQVNHIVRCLKQARKAKANKVEISVEANDRFFQSMLEKRKDQVFWQDSCSVANSYYFNQHGDVPLRPSLTLETIWHSRRFDLNDYEFSR